MKKLDNEVRALDRRRVLGAGVAGAVLMALPEACGGQAATVDAGALDARRADGGHVEGTFVDGGGSCVQTDRTRPISISQTGIGPQGTSTEFSDPRYSDPLCGNDKIILIHPTTKDVYVAMSGSCPHTCCDTPSGIGGPSYHATLRLGHTEHHDVVYCSCHGSLFDALDGSVLQGPSGHGLPLLTTCEGGGYVFVSIPA